MKHVDPEKRNERFDFEGDLALGVHLEIFHFV